MYANTFALLFAATISAASALTIDKRAPCTSYTIIYTRGILAPQDEWKPVEMMNSQITGKMPGAKLYNTVYPAAPDLDGSVGTADILNKIQTTLQSNPSECFFLEGYSLGAMATINALSKLTGASAAAVKVGSTIPSTIFLDVSRSDCLPHRRVSSSSATHTARPASHATSMTQAEHQRYDEQKTEEDESHNKRQSTEQPPAPPQKRAARQPITSNSIEDWHKACATAFMRKPTMTAFPEPPAEPCGVVSCNAERGRALKACKCDIRKAFQGRKSRLKMDRFTFHADRFAGVPEEVREKVQQAAKEVFVVVEAMYRGN